MKSHLGLWARTKTGDAWLEQEGMFGLREWEEEGFTPQAQDAEDPSYDPVAVRKSRQPAARVLPTLPPMCQLIMYYTVTHAEQT